jgi:hypothetical protein
MATSKLAAEVGFQLLDIFLLFGAPHILQSDNGREFTANIIKELKDMWTDCTLVHGKPRHPPEKMLTVQFLHHSQTLLCMVIYLFQSDGYCSFQTTNFRPILFYFLLLFSHVKNHVLSK